MNPPPGPPGRSQAKPQGGDETPISKYLANLEKKKSIFHPRASPQIKPRMEGVTMKLNFDDTFYGGGADQSLLLSSPSESLGLLASSSLLKRRRTSMYPIEAEEVDPAIYQARISDLEKLLRQTQAELIDCRTACTKLEQASNIAKNSFTEKLILSERSEAESKTRLKEADDKVILLETKLEQSLNRETELSSNLRQQRESYNTKFAAAEEELAELKKENFDLKQKLHEGQIESEKALRKLQSEYNETEKGAEKWIMDSQIYQDQLKFAQAQLEKCQAELKTAQLHAIKFQQVALTNEAATASSNAELSALEERVRKFENLYVKEQSSNFTLTKSLEMTKAENEILRSTIRSEMILHEQITSLENQITFLRQEVAEKGKAEAERDGVKNELRTLKEIISRLDYNCNTPLAFESSLRQTQSLMVELKHDNTTLKLELDNANRNCAKLQNELLSLRDEVTRLKDGNNKLATEGKKLSKRLFLLVKDRDGLKDLKESYEKEFEGQISEPLKARISNLEGIISGYEVMINEEQKKTCPDCEAKAVLMESLRAELENAQRQNETLSQTISTAQDDGTIGIKIVSLANNPSMMSIDARLQECLKENEDLKEKLRSYEEGTLVLPSTGSANFMEKKKLEDDLRALERKHEILTEAYNYETVQLQQACTKLFGFYVTLIREPQSQIRLQSVNSTSPDDLFIFQEAENNDMMLLETPVLEHFREDIDRFLLRDGSIPSFLASVTITYSQDGGRFSQSSSSQSQSQISAVPASVSLATGGNRMQQQHPSQSQGQGQGRRKQELQQRGGRESESSEEEQEEDEEDDYGEEEAEHDDEGGGDDDEEDEESDEPEDVIMIDSD